MILVKLRNLAKPIIFRKEKSRCFENCLFAVPKDFNISSEAKMLKFLEVLCDVKMC